MGLGEKLSKELVAWTTVAITVVIASVLLLKFKSANPGNMTCTVGGTYPYYNVSGNVCSNTTTAAGGEASTTAINTVAQTTDTFITAFSEPKNWIVIVIIALIGVGVLMLFRKSMGAGKE